MKKYTVVETDQICVEDFRSPSAVLGRIIDALNEAFDAIPQIKGARAFPYTEKGHTFGLRITTPDQQEPHLSPVQRAERDAAMIRSSIELS